MGNITPNFHIDPRRAALLVIDVQRALFSRPTPIHDAEQFLGNMNSLIEMWHLTGGVVLYIQHSNNRMLIRDTPDWELHPDLIHKLHGNAFQRTNLKDILDSPEKRGILAR